MRSKKAFYNATTGLLTQIVSVIYGFIVPKIILNYFGSSVNGLVSSITQFLGYIALLQSGFGPVVKSLLYKPIARKDKKEIASILKSAEKFFRTIGLIFIVYIVVLMIIFPLIINSDFPRLYTMSLLIIIAISTLSEYFFGITYNLYIASEQSNYLINLVSCVSYILNGLLVVISVKIFPSIHIVKGITSIVFLIKPFCANYFVKKKFGINLKDADGNYKIKNKWDGLAQHIASTIHNNTDVTVLTLFCPLETVSVYAVYRMVFSSIKNIVNSISGGIDASFGDMIAKEEYENLNKKFSAYELIHFTITTIAFTCTMVLIVPFVSVYTKNIHDANYIQYAFGYLIVISEYLWCLRIPYSGLTLTAGHFKETKKGAWLECVVNITLSVVLVIKYGLIGVAIGTIVAMLIRTIEFVYHTNKYIIRRNISISVKKLLIVVLETLLIVGVYNILPLISYDSYMNWVINALMTGVSALIITLGLNRIFYKEEFNIIINTFKRLFKRNKVKKDA